MANDNRGERVGDESLGESSSWTIRARERVYEAMKWKVERSLRSLDGGETEHEFHTVEMPDFVNVVPITETGEAVMVRQFRHGIERPALEFPGGLVDAGEAPAVAARREMLEETGCDGEVTEIGCLWPNPAMINNKLWVFHASVTRVGTLNLEASEDIKVVRVPIKELFRMPSEGRIRGAMQVAIVHLLERRLRG